MLCHSWSSKRYAWNLHLHLSWSFQIHPVSSSRLIMLCGLAKAMCWICITRLLFFRSSTPSELQALDNRLKGFAAAILQQECFPHISLICLLAISHMEALNATLAFSTVHVFKRKEKEGGIEWSNNNLIERSWIPVHTDILSVYWQVHPAKYTGNHPQYNSLALWRRLLHRFQCFGMH